MKRYRYQLFVMGMMVFQSNALRHVKREAGVWFDRLGVSYADIWSHGRRVYTRTAEGAKWQRVKGGCMV